MKPRPQWMSQAWSGMSRRRATSEWELPRSASSLCLFWGGQSGELSFLSCCKLSLGDFCTSARTDSGLPSFPRSTQIICCTAAMPFFTGLRTYRMGGAIGEEKNEGGVRNPITNHRKTFHR